MLTVDEPKEEVKGSKSNSVRFVNCPKMYFNENSFAFDNFIHLLSRTIPFNFTMT